jgi:hypothetical protein
MFSEKSIAQPFMPTPLTAEFSWRAISRITGNPADIRTGNIQNTNLEPCHSTSLLDHMVGRESEISDFIRDSYKVEIVLDWNRSRRICRVDCICQIFLKSVANFGDEIYGHYMFILYPYTFCKESVKFLSILHMNTI